MIIKVKMFFESESCGTRVWVYESVHTQRKQLAWHVEQKPASVLIAFELNVPSCCHVLIWLRISTFKKDPQAFRFHGTFGSKNRQIRKVTYTHSHPKLSKNVFPILHDVPTNHYTCLLVVALLHLIHFLIQINLTTFTSQEKSPKLEFWYLSLGPRFNKCSRIIVS